MECVFSGKAEQQTLSSTHNQKNPKKNQSYLKYLTAPSQSVLRSKMFFCHLKENTENTVFSTVNKLKESPLSEQYY